MKTRKIVALLLAVVMVFAMSASAFAIDTGDTYSSYTFDDLKLKVQVSMATEGLTISGNGRSATIAADTGRDIPQAFSLILSDSTGKDFVQSEYTITTTRAAIFDFDNSGTQDAKYGYGVVELYGDLTEITIQRSGYSGQCMINVPTPTAQRAGTGLVAFLPAAGQFVNEGANSSGWGGAFTKKNANTLKGIVEGYVSTGVSLGSFGGYVVMDFGEPAKDATGKVTGGIFNDAANAYGVDFTLYGNAMGTWAEPGCVQVSQDGSTWYTLAGSLHYQTPTYTVATDETVTETDEEGNALSDFKTITVSKSGAIWNYSVTYTNPVAENDTLATGETGTTGKNVVYSYTGLSENGKGRVLFNNWHRHNYFPLLNNYFVGVNGHTALDGIVNTISPLALGDYASYTPKASSTVGAKLTMSGVRLMPASNSTAPDTFLFGYVDCHPNGTLSTVQVNPYTTGRTSNDNSNGDPMDLSWAVDDNGNPVYLASVRYVRVYTGVMQMNGMMGESSTEVLGSHRATKKGATAAVQPTIKVGGYSLTRLERLGATVERSVVTGSSNQEIITITNLSAAVSGEFSVEATGSDYVFMNGVNTTSTTVASDATSTVIQIINQSGVGNAYITLLKISK